MAIPRALRFRWALPFAAALGCAPALLPVRPASELYETGEADVPSLSSSQRELADGLNAALARQGLAKATPGAFEMDVAALIANAGRTKENGATGAGASRGTNLGMGAAEESAADSEAKVHPHRIAYQAGLPGDFSAWYSVEDFPKHMLGADDFDKAAKNLAPPLPPMGKLRLGVAVVTDGWDNHRVFALVLRDELIDLQKGPPRTIDPQKRFSMAGTLAAGGGKVVVLRLLRPGGQIDRQEIPVGDGGHFQLDYTIPAEKGLYVATLSAGERDVVSMPIFVGVPQSVWPPLAAKGAPAASTSRDVAEALVKAVALFRKGDSRPDLSLTPELCALAKKLAEENLDDAKLTEKLKGLDASLAFHREWVREDEVADRAAATPTNASAAEFFLAPVKAFGLGVARLPKKSPDDDNVYGIVWLAKKAAPAPPSAAR